ncbi:carbamoyltransferase C-terminal domain-containing protein [Ruegeria arenilitoris]|uniref:carbamoyltransferase C-terminal domain-containing protein n=1 Tax=Ruegeria arenilitoris TaxID=1173585 RepID=UPI0014798EC4|nr:carbamoyltransferase C-terminal domain-containing protein [Ruegeria arenilitoris]
MKILSFKSGHDGSVAGIDAPKEHLMFSYEAEKDSLPRNSPIDPNTLIDAGLWFNELPDVLALSGWSTRGENHTAISGAGSFGIDESSAIVGTKNFFGKRLDYYSSSHERSLIWATYAMSPFEQGEPCYVLVWEDALGDFYEIDRDLMIHHKGRVLAAPGRRFSFLYALADPAFSGTSETLGKDFSSKLQSASAHGDARAIDGDAQGLIDALLNNSADSGFLHKDTFRGSPYHNVGVTSPRFQNLAAKYSDAVFSRFHDFAKTNLTKHYPLLISGECGLNYRWNTRWRDSGLFRDVFIPPCTNDSGCAIGTAVDAMRHFTGRAKLDWTVYAGQPFNDDRIDMEGVTSSELNLSEVAAALYDGMVIGWVMGNCEIGPRALGNRSILAAPFSTETRDRVNKIKGRAGLAPVSPVCLEEDVSKHFDWSGPSPHMLHFQQVTDPRLKAVNHVDGSARVQTVTKDQNAMLHDLLTEFKATSGVGVLCNTSLNFKRSGFINKTSDLYKFARSVGLDGFVAGRSFYCF